MNLKEPEFSERLLNFCSAWADSLGRHQERSFSSRLRQFSLDWLKLNASQLPIPQPVEPVDAKAYRAVAEELGRAISRLRSTGALANAWAASGLGRNEIRVARVLNWFIDCLGDHGQEHRLCCAMLNQVNDGISTMQDRSRFPDFPQAGDLLSNEGRACYRSRTEVRLLGDQENRVDIEVNGPNVLLLIEVKIDSNEGDKQIERYHRIAKSNARGRAWGVVYLTLDGVLPKESRALINTAPLAWADISHCFRDYANALPEGLARHYIETFSDFIDTL